MQSATKPHTPNTHPVKAALTLTAAVTIAVPVLVVRWLAEVQP